MVYLESNLPLYPRLPEALKEQLRVQIGQFVATTFFEGCGGLELTDEMILTVAGQACLLTVNKPGRPYPNLRTVLMYPGTYSSSMEDYAIDGTISKKRVARLGESWGSGTVVLAWDAVQKGARNIYDGHNVTLHEFAHQLDQLDGASDGVPILRSREAYQTWGHVLVEGLAELQDDVFSGRKTLLDAYGATNRAEYFAVATETFFEKPKQMQAKEPELYAALSEYYQLSPVEWYD